jgi:hypothetical protein
MHILKYIYFLSIASLLFYFVFWDNTHGPSFHFYLYNVRKESTFYFEEFDKSFFVSLYYNFVVIITIPNAHRSLLSLVVCNKVEPKFVMN